MVGGPSVAQEAGTNLLYGNRLSIDIEISANTANTIFTQSGKNVLLGHDMANIIIMKLRI